MIEDVGARRLLKMAKAKRAVGGARDSALIAMILLLGACQKSPEVSRAEYERLQGRVALLESQMAKSSDSEQAESLPSPAPEVQVPKPQMSYQLIGTSFRDEGTFRYPSKSRCEEAREALLENWRAEDEQNRAKGILFTSRPAPSCLPL